MHIANVQKGDVLRPVSHKVPAGRQVRSLIFTALNGLDVDAPQIDLEGPGETPSRALAVAEMLGVQYLDFLSGDMLGDRQVSCKGRDTVFLINGLGGGDASWTDEELLETLSTAQSPKRLGMAVVEVFMADEDIVVDWLGRLQVLAEKVGVKGEIDVA